MALLNGGGSEQLGEMELSLAFLGQTQGGKVERREMNSNQSIDCHNYKMSTHLWLHRWRRRGRRVERSKIARQTPWALRPCPLRGYRHYLWIIKSLAIGTGTGTGAAVESLHLRW